MGSGNLMLELKNVSKRYAAPGGGAAPIVLKHISLKLQAGATVAILGPSGSGKSTLLNIIGGLDRPTSGRVLLNGSDLARASDTELARIRSRDIGFIFQSHHLLPQCTVWENVLIPALAAKSPGLQPAVEDRARRLLERVGLLHRLTHRPGQLSGGECQRVAVVRSLINGPRLLLADEPTGSLDRTSAKALAALLVELNREEGVTLIVVTHAQALSSKMKRAFELVDGKLVSGHLRR